MGTSATQIAFESICILCTHVIDSTYMYFKIIMIHDVNKMNEFYDIGSIQEVFRVHKCVFTFNSFIILFPKFSIVVKVVIYLVTNHFICTFKFSYVRSCKLSLWF